MPSTLIKFGASLSHGESLKAHGTLFNGLLDLLRLGHNVPEGWILPVDVLRKHLAQNNLDKDFSLFQEELKGHFPSSKITASKLREGIVNAPLPRDISNEFESLFSNQPKLQLAVRISHTFTGGFAEVLSLKYKAILNIKSPEDLIATVKSHWSGLFDEDAINCILDNNTAPPDLNMSLILQLLIDADKSGLIFTVDPTTGVETQVAIETCFGLGEGLSLIDNPFDRYVFDWKTGKIASLNIPKKKSAFSTFESSFTAPLEVENKDRKHQLLDFAEVKSLAKIGIDIQCHYGHPIRLEWAMKQGKVYLLQVNPLKNINFSGIKGQWTLATPEDLDCLSDSSTFLNTALYSLAFNKAMADYLKVNSTPKDAPWMKIHFSHPYRNVITIKCSFYTLFKTLPTQLKQSRCLFNEQNLRLDKLERLNFGNLTDLEYFNLLLEIIRCDYLKFESEYIRFVLYFMDLTAHFSKFDYLKKGLFNRCLCFWLGKKIRSFSARKKNLDRQSIRLNHLVKKACLELGERLVSKGQIGKKEDIFFLSPDELFSYLKEVDKKDLDLKNLVRINSLYFNSFRNFKPST